MCPKNDEKNTHNFLKHNYIRKTIKVIFSFQNINFHNIHFENI